VSPYVLDYFIILGFIDTFEIEFLIEFEYWELEGIIFKDGPYLGIEPILGGPIVSVEF